MMWHRRLGGIMSDSLGTYIHDHLAGATIAVETLKSMLDRQRGTPLAEFAAKLLVDVEADRETLKNLAEIIGAGPATLKEIASWLAERAGRFKLNQDSSHSLGTFEALELLEVGIYGKWAMWRALEVISRSDRRLAGVDFRQLVTRAEAQRAIVAERRLEVARNALASESA